MRRFMLAVVTAAVLLSGAAAAKAGIVVIVDKTAQQLTVNVDGVTRYRWPVSTARWGYNTPNGSYRPQRLERQWYSRKYDWSPMPHSIFFAGGYAIHGSYEVSRLGRPASHGCIRLHPNNAAILFDLVKRNVNNTRIEVTGGGPELMARQQRRERETTAAVEHSTPPRRHVTYEERPSTRRHVASKQRPASRSRVVYEERPKATRRVTYDAPPATRGRVYYYDEPPVTYRAGRQVQTFEEVFGDPPRYTRRRADRTRWEDYR
jgi:hypothetical protein